MIDLLFKHMLNLCHGNHNTVTFFRSRSRSYSSYSSRSYRSYSSRRSYDSRSYSRSYSRSSYSRSPSTGRYSRRRSPLYSKSKNNPPLVLKAKVDIKPYDPADGISTMTDVGTKGTVDLTDPKTFMSKVTPETQNITVMPVMGNGTKRGANVLDGVNKDKNHDPSNIPMPGSTNNIPLPPPHMSPPYQGGPRHFNPHGGPRGMPPPPGGMRGGMRPNFIGPMLPHDHPLAQRGPRGPPQLRGPPNHRGPLPPNMRGPPPPNMRGPPPHDMRGPHDPHMRGPMPPRGPPFMRGPPPMGGGGGPPPRFRGMPPMQRPGGPVGPGGPTGPGGPSVY